MDQTSPGWSKRDRHKVGGLFVGRRISSRSLTGRRGQEGVFHTLVVSRDTGREALVHQCGRRTGTGEETRKTKRSKLLCEVRSAKQAPEANQAVAAEGGR